MFDAPLEMQSHSGGEMEWDYLKAAAGVGCFTWGAGILTSRLNKETSSTTQ